MSQLAIPESDFHEQSSAIFDEQLPVPVGDSSAIKRGKRVRGVLYEFDGHFIG